MLIMELTWQDKPIEFQGLPDAILQEVSSKQLECLQSTNSISQFYHLHLHTPQHCANNTSDVIPVKILPLIQKHNSLFKNLNHYLLYVL